MRWRRVGHADPFFIRHSLHLSIEFVARNNHPALTVRIEAFRYNDAAVIALPQFDVNAGDTVVVSGRSGSGKSTLLHVATGVLALARTQGSVKLSGLELAELAQIERDCLRPYQVGWIPQRVHLISALNVIDNVLLPFTMSRGASTSRNAFRPRARELLADVGLAQYENAMPSTLSVGQASRVCAVRALVAKPVLLCADEPSAALDRESANAIAQVFARYVREGGSALIASHDQAFIDTLGTLAPSVRTLSIDAQ